MEQRRSHLRKSGFEFFLFQIPAVNRSFKSNFRIWMYRTESETTLRATICFWNTSFASAVFQMNTLMNSTNHDRLKNSNEPIGFK